MKSTGTLQIPSFPGSEQNQSIQDMILFQRMTEFRVILETIGELSFSLRKRDESLFSTREQYRYSTVHQLSQVGNRQKHLFTALSKLRSFTAVNDTSFLYDTKAMYETNQNRFLNAVCKVETDLSPIDLLRACKRIEKEMGREKTYRSG